MGALCVKRTLGVRLRIDTNSPENTSLEHTYLRTLLASRGGCSLTGYDRHDLLPDLRQAPNPRPSAKSSRIAAIVAYLYMPAQLDANLTVFFHSSPTISKAGPVLR